MKRKLPLLSLAVGCFLNLNSQVLVLNENFNSSFQLNASSGWTVVNNSQPVGTTGWFAGTASVFPALTGSATEYYAANFNSTAGSGDISNWLISPSIQLMNGAVIKFATRTNTNLTTYPDRLEVRLSAVDNNTLPLGSSAVGTFTNLAFSVNPALSASLPTSVSSNSVNGYPKTWTVYSATVAGITGTVSGRLAFRYYVTNGGPNGANSSYIGLDSVSYRLPCLPQPSLTAISGNTAGVCSGNSVTLTVSNSGTPVPVSYAWSSGGTGTSVVVSPSASTTYTVAGTSSLGCTGTATVAVTVTATPNVVVPSYTVCTLPAASNITLSASGGSTYAWTNNSATTSAIVVSPTATTVYTVTAYGSNTVCPAVQTATITLGAFLSMDISSSTTSLCTGSSATLSALNAAGSYSWSVGTSTASSIVVSPTTSTTYTVEGFYAGSPSVCAGANTITINVFVTPTVAVAASPSSTLCSGQIFTATASGADTYIYTLGSLISNNNPFVITTPPVGSLTILQYSVVGTTTDGCSATAVNSLYVNPNPTLVISPFAPNPCYGQVISISVTGANNYNWSGPINSNSSSISYTAGGTSTTVVVALTGTASNGCVASSSVNIVVTPCVGIDEKAADAGVRMYPNPFRSELMIEGSATRIEIYNILGQEVMRIENYAGGAIQTAALTRGIYVIKAFDGEHLLKSSRLLKD